MSIGMIDFKKLHESMMREIEGEVQRVLRSGWYILGQEVEAFEREFADYHRVSHAVAVANGTDAIELALRAYGIGAGDEVITVAHTAMPTVTAIEECGAKPVLVDIHPESYTIDTNQIRQAITERTKAIIPVHIYGQPAHLEALQAIADEHSLLLLEDCAQAHGARWQGQLVGTFGQMASYSFYPTKNLGAYGDAGAILTNDDYLAEQLRQLRNYGQETRYYNVQRGVNSRMDEIQAAILRVKLRYLDEHNAIRRALAVRYNEALGDVETITCPIEREGVEHVYHLYVIRHDERDALQAYLADKGIQTGIHYPIPIHEQVSHRDLGYGTGSLPVTEAFAKQILSLPLHPTLTEAEQDNVIQALRDFRRV